MAFEGLKIPDAGFLLNPVQSLPGAAVEGYGQGMAMNDLFKKYQMNAINLDQAKRTQAATKAQDTLSASAPATPEGQMQVAAGLAQQGFGQEAATQQKWAQEWQQHNQEFSSKSQEMLRERMSSSARFLEKLPPADLPLAWDRFKKDLSRDGYDISDIPPQPTPEALESMKRSTLSQKNVEDLQSEKDKLAEEKRWHDLQYQADLAKAKAAGGGLTTAWTDHGLVIVDKKTGVYTPTTPAGGAGGAAAPIPKQTPPQINTAIANNLNQINKIDNALAKLDAYKGSTGMIKGMVGGSRMGNAVLNKADPKGIEARAALADVGSGVIHDRTGAAMNIHEEARLTPFVPDMYGDYTTNKKKLLRFKKFIEDNNAVLKATYPAAGPGGGGGGGASSGWAPPDAAPQPPAGQIWSRVKPK